MLTGAVARRYAQALLEIGTQTGTLDQLERELGQFVAMLDEQRDLQRVLFHPSVVVADKKELVGKLLTQEAGYSAATRAFVLLIIERRREGFFSEIYREFVRLTNQVRNVVEAKVISAVEMTDEEIERLKAQLSRLTGKIVVLEKRVDPGLIGGVVVSIGDRIIDGSVAGKLRDLKETLLRASLPSVG